MRVSTNQTQTLAVNAMLDQQAKLSKVQEQVATGRKIAKPSEDPVAAAKIVNLNDILKTTEQYKSNITIARARLNLEEGALAHSVDIYHRIRELSLEANNATQTNETRGFIAEEVSQLLDELLSLANSSDSTGEFLFAGNKGHFKPFGRNDKGGFDYYGDDGQRQIQIGPKRKIAINDSGNQIFREIRDGNGRFAVLDSPTNRGSGVIDPGAVTGQYDLGTYAIIFDRKPSMNPNEPLTYHVIDAKGETVVAPGQVFKEGNAIEFRGIHTSINGEPAAGDYFVIRPSFNQDIFTTLQGFVDALRVGRGTPSQHAQLNNEINRVLSAMDVALGRTLEVRANVGARLNALDSQENINEALKIQVKEILSGVEDLDYSKAVSDLNLKLTSLQASQKAFTRVQDISLFNYL
jgi:flagellar hook-associated protein 3 FlgL